MFTKITLFLGLLFLASAELIFNGVLPYPSSTITSNILITGTQSGMSYGPSTSSLSSGSSLYLPTNNYISSTQTNSVIMKGSLASPQPTQSTIYYPTKTSMPNIYSSQPLSAAMGLTSNSLNSGPIQISNIYSSSLPQVSYKAAAPVIQPSYNSMSLGSSILSNSMNSIASGISTSSSYAKETTNSVSNSGSSSNIISSSNLISNSNPISSSKIVLNSNSGPSSSSNSITSSNSGSGSNFNSLNSLTSSNSASNYNPVSSSNTDTGSS